MTFYRFYTLLLKYSQHSDLFIYLVDVCDNDLLIDLTVSEYIANLKFECRILFGILI